jgi:Cft2 family RNA processing exonuclease
MGYTLGKAQLLCKIFEDYSPYVDENIKKINDVYRECGVESLRDFKSFEQTKQLKIPPWLLITSPTSRRAKLMRKVNAKTAIFTGWGVSKNYTDRMKVDQAFPLSDHADFNELVKTVEKCNPEKVFVSHGFDHEFAAYLKSRGFEAKPLSYRKSPIINFSEI